MLDLLGNGINNGQQTTLAYSGGMLSSIPDPANRKATLGYTGAWLTSITDPANERSASAPAFQTRSCQRVPGRDRRPPEKGWQSGGLTR